MQVKEGALKAFFGDEHLMALMSDASINFMPTDFDAPLTAEQRVYLKREFDLDVPKVFWRKQVHSNDVLVARGGVDGSKDRPDADACITDEKDLPIAIRTADCVPVFIFDGRRRAIGLAHAGWKGTYKGIAARTIQKMHEQFSCRTSDLKVFLGPSIRECCYQVGEEFRAFFPSYIKERQGRLYADMISANLDQLLQAGIRRENMSDSGLCTCCDKDYFSFRRDGQKAGRMISLMMLK